MQDKTNIVIVGYGNVGRGVHEAIKRNPDTSLVGIISRNLDRVEKEIVGEVAVYDQNYILKFETTQPVADVAILCGGSKNDLPEQGILFASRYNTVDSFDTHADILDYFRKMSRAASFQSHTSIVCAGWDPGTFSVNRVLMDAFLPGAIPKGFYGLEDKGGLSMGHSQAIRTIDGVKDAKQYTHAIPEAIEKIKSGENPDLKPGEMHWRECYVVAEIGKNEDIMVGMERIRNEIKNMKDYFEPYETIVNFVTQEKLDGDFFDMPHDGLVLAVGETGKGNRAMIEYKNVWESNPEATGNVLVACARACKRFNRQHKLGAYTMLDLSPADLSPYSQKELLKDFM